MDEERIENMDMRDKVRDSLILIATMRMVRRSKEIVTMSLDEVDKAEDLFLEVELYKIINVADQKNARGRKAAPIVYNSTEFKALTVYISQLRRKFGTEVNINSVFLASSCQYVTPSSLNYSSYCKILQKFTSTSGKIYLHGSKVAASRKKTTHLKKRSPWQRRCVTQ